MRKDRARYPEMRNGAAATTAPFYAERFGGEAPPNITPADTTIMRRVNRPKLSDAERQTSTSGAGYNTPALPTTHRLIPGP